mmetsp:Transcript_71171/g.114861  ORF Transcript_71171/g.114861 Transcript_71171/m.114861 type:complete len:243 (-) Transcript_71171:114-842(-)
MSTHRRLTKRRGRPLARKGRPCSSLIRSLALLLPWHPPCSSRRRRCHGRLVTAAWGTHLCSILPRPVWHPTTATRTSARRRAASDASRWVTATSVRRRLKLLWPFDRHAKTLNLYLESLGGIKVLALNCQPLPVLKLSEEQSGLTKPSQHFLATLGLFVVLRVHSSHLGIRQGADALQCVSIISHLISSSLCRGIVLLLLRRRQQLRLWLRLHLRLIRATISNRPSSQGWIRRRRPYGQVRP